jgi:hypothetical protein
MRLPHALRGLQSVRIPLRSCGRDVTCNGRLPTNFPSYRMSIQMAWFYNPIFGQNLEIGLVAASRRPYGSAATAGRNFAFFLGILHSLKNRFREKRKKRHF